MKHFSFKNDYSEGAHPTVLEALAKENLSQNQPYGEDVFCDEARKILKMKMANEDAVIEFVSGGTMANLVIISHLLRPIEAVIAANTAHIDVHETGAIEAVGHKIISCNSQDGKLSTTDIQEVVNNHKDEHKVVPRLVYISNSTELGTVYSKSELQSLYQCCKENHLLLFLDGARLSQGICSSATDLELKDVSWNTDVFTFGATKNGALFGEAIVFNSPELAINIRYTMKQKGALMAKGRSFGLQFNALLKDNLYKKLAESANEKAQLLAESIQNAGHSFLIPVESNLLFPILPNTLINALLTKYDFYIWKKLDQDTSVVRMVCSWATPHDMITQFVEDLKRFS